MADIVATISSSDELFVTTFQQDLTAASADIAAPAVVESLDNVADVDTSTYGKLNGSVLVYRTTTNKWTSTTTLDAQNMEGGEF
jgi:membrane-bound lytic murein transglycosylase MltF